MWLERGTAKGKCLAKEENTMYPARAQTWTAQAGLDHHASLNKGCVSLGKSKSIFLNPKMDIVFTLLKSEN